MASPGASPSGGRGLPRILISNDDGISAPGLLALADALHSDQRAGGSDWCEFAVSGPSGERSAQSHCITVSAHLHAWPIEVPGATEAYAVDGTPADSVMIAIYGPLLKVGAPAGRRKLVAARRSSSGAAPVEGRSPGQ